MDVRKEKINLEGALSQSRKLLRRAHQKMLRGYYYTYSSPRILKDSPQHDLIVEIRMMHS